MHSNTRFMDRRRFLLSAAAAGGVALAGTGGLGARPARAAGRVTAPKVFDRKAWGAVPPVPPSDHLPLIDPPDTIVIHHTTGPNSNDFSDQYAFARSRSIQQFHINTRHWGDTGQHLTIARGGQIMEGRNRSLEAINARRFVEGAHVYCNNDHALGIENDGTYISETPTSRHWDALVATCAWLCDVYGLNPNAAIKGHRDMSCNEGNMCPGNALYNMLPRLRSEVSDRLNQPVGLPGHPR